jgi:hypothetical protein
MTIASVSTFSKIESLKRAITGFNSCIFTSKSLVDNPFEAHVTSLLEVIGSKIARPSKKI